MDINEELMGAIKLFCSMLPNINDLHHPNDLRRLMNLAYCLHVHEIVFSEIQYVMEDELSLNAHFESDDISRKQFLKEHVEPTIATMIEHIVMVAVKEYRS